MATTKAEIIDPKKEAVKQTHRENWEVMRPFVSFSYKAVKAIGITLIAIVKASTSLLKPGHTSVKRR
jgi:hypothetical protein